MEGEATHRHRNLLLGAKLVQTSLKGGRRGRRRVQQESFWKPGVLYSPKTIGRGLKHAATVAYLCPIPDVNPVMKARELC